VARHFVEAVPNANILVRIAQRLHSASRYLDVPLIEYEAPADVDCSPSAAMLHTLTTGCKYFVIQTPWTSNHQSTELSHHRLKWLGIAYKVMSWVWTIWSVTMNPPRSGGTWKSKETSSKQPTILTMWRNQQFKKLYYFDLPVTLPFMI
jgi:hypothetical protein